MKRLFGPLRPLGEAVTSAAVWTGLMALGGILLVVRALLSRTSVWIGRACSVGVLVYAWHSLVRNYDLSELDGTPAFRYGVILTGTIGWGTFMLAAFLDSGHRKLTALKPVPVDPDFPPTKMVYLQGDGAPERCACHNRVIEDGTEIWHWPQPAKLVCVKKGHAK